MRAEFSVKGIDRLMKDLKKLEKMPQVAVNRAARLGAQVAFKHAKMNAPMDSGDMRKGLVMKGEKRTKKGKKVYFISYSKSMNDQFVKDYAGGKKRAYYPASQEWGFTVMGKYTPGYRTLRKAIDQNANGIQQAVLKSLRKDVDKALGGK